MYKEISIWDDPFTTTILKKLVSLEGLNKKIPKYSD